VLAALLTVVVLYGLREPNVGEQEKTTERVGSNVADPCLALDEKPNPTIIQEFVDLLAHPLSPAMAKWWVEGDPVSYCSLC
jgi:hypothetical protein